MASRRILGSFSIKPYIFSSLTLIVAVLLLASCGTTGQTSRQPDQTPGTEPSAETEPGVSEELVSILESSRSRLSDVYAASQSEIPEFFRQQSDTRNIGDPNQGYRVQILSTRDVSQADSIANDFRTWAQERFAGYIPEAYVLYRQPYYKVHIGNFQFQDHAMKLNKVLKSRYSEAWVVPDEVEPDLVPPEDFTFQDQDQKQDQQ